MSTKLLGFFRAIRKTLGLIRSRERVNSANLSLALQQIATLSSAQYILKEFGTVEVFENQEDVLFYSLEQAKLEGCVLEFGVFEGRTLRFISRNTNQTVHGFDSFKGLPENWRTGFRKGHFAIQEIPSFPKNVILHIGLFSDSIPEFINDHGGDNLNVRFLHIDCDVYSSTKDVLNGLSTMLKPGTVIVFDEYFNYPGWENGEWLAFQEFCREQGRTYRYLAYNRVHEQVSIVIE
jgi:hypothetical protein